MSSAESCSLFNNSEGKGSFGSDEDPNEQRVEMYLAHPRETKGAWMGGADTPVRGGLAGAEPDRIHDLWGQATKCMWWMPWRLQAMKDVAACEKLRGAGKRALIRRCPNGETRPTVKRLSARALSVRSKPPRPSGREDTRTLNGGSLPSESIGWVEQTR